MESSARRTRRAPLAPEWLEAALRQPGCAVCHEMEQITRDYLRTLLGSEGVRDRLQETWGLCRQHTRGLLSEHSRADSRLAAAALYRSLGEALLKRAGWTGPHSPAAGPLLSRGLLKSEGMCLACEQLGEYQRAVVQALVEALAAGQPPGISEAYSRTEGLCLPHLRLALRVAGDPDTVNSLMREFLGGIARLVAELSALRPNDDRGADLVRGAAERFAGRPEERVTAS